MVILFPKTIIQHIPYTQQGPRIFRCIFLNFWRTSVESPAVTTVDTLKFWRTWSQKSRPVNKKKQKVAVAVF